MVIIACFYNVDLNLSFSIIYRSFTLLQMIGFSKGAAPEIEHFGISLSSNYLVIPSSEDSDETDRIEGKIKLSLNSPLNNIKSVDFRFVGGVVTHLKTSKQSLYGRIGLFDSKVTLSEEPNFEEDQEFDFFISLPAGSPASIDIPGLKIQYLMIAVLGFENGCCGLIPILQREPLLAKQEIKVHSIGLHSSFDSRSTCEDVKSKMQVALLDGDDKEFLIWTPNPLLLVKIEPVQYSCVDWTLRVQVDQNLTLDKFEYAVVESFTYRYT